MGELTSNLSWLPHLALCWHIVRVHTAHLHGAAQVDTNMPALSSAATDTTHLHWAAVWHSPDAPGHKQRAGGSQNGNHALPNWPQHQLEASRIRNFLKRNGKNENGHRLYTGDFQLFSSRDTHKLLTKILWHTQKLYFLLIWQKLGIIVIDLQKIIVITYTYFLKILFIYF